METPPRAGLGAEIVAILESYNKQLPIDFLAHILRRTTGEIRADLKSLEQHRAVRLSGDYVELWKNLERE